MIVYISIGNSDDRLTQCAWSHFVLDMSAEVTSLGLLRGAWFSLSTSAYQNACWCVEFSGPDAQAEANVVAEAKKVTAELAAEYKQDSIAWAVAPLTEFIGGTS